MSGELGKTWFHGSPCKLTILHKGSTITEDRDLARVFSHQPTLVSVSDDGKIAHDGTMPGFLYRIAEAVGPGDLEPHPRSTMAAGKEWITTRALRLTLLGPTQVIDEERLTPERVAALVDCYG